VTHLPAPAPWHRLSNLPFSYAEVGATAHADLPPGFGHLERSRVIGAGPDAFDRARTGLMSWQMHRRAGFGLVADSPTAATGSCALIVVGRRPFAVTAPCRVVYEVTGDARCGFAYGTLPGHPESGEESFVVTHGDDDRVIFTVRAFSRPATRLARIGGPLTRVVQKLATERYLRALQAIALERSVT
jgi:uncharacterized protein (UPF0548 family)